MTRRLPQAPRRAVALLVIGLAAWAGVSAADGLSRTPDEHRRGGVQTYRSLPEWRPVQSQAELADYLAAQRAPSAFPFFSQVAQFWQSYGEISQATPSQTFDAGYHLRSIMIGLQTSAEYSLKACYEATVGRLAEASATGPTAEEQLAARVAQDHATFIRSRPAREYDYGARLKELWQATPLWGDDLLRKWERRFALSTEYGAKAAYGWLMQQVDKPASPPPPATTALLLDRWPSGAAELPAMKRLRDLGTGVLVSVPRRGGFTHHAGVLARQGVQIAEVAGNQGPILVSLLTPRDAAPVAEARLLFAQPVLTRPDTERRWLTVPVPQLADALRAWTARPELQVEHLYDY
ncbi:hypothetical protein [Ideonella sp.]|uniref:hypothetical protein n=1 Tax=Ideonella sp. TaxID=1929293 RepID=UPI0035ADCCF5